MLYTQNIKKIGLLFLTLIASNISFSQSVTDSEIKKNVTLISSPLNKISQLKPKTFEYDTQNFKHLSLADGKQYGFIAEEIQEVFPDLVNQQNISYLFGKNSYRNTKIKTIDEASLIPLLVASIQEQQQQIEELTKEIKNLKNKS